MIFRMIAARWAEDAGLKPRAFEGDYEFEQLERFNAKGYNVYYLPNHPSDYSAIPLNDTGKRKRSVIASDIDVFNYVFVDLDMKDYQSEHADRRHDFATKQDFIDFVQAQEGLTPSCIVDTGGGIHVYWRVIDLDAMSYLRLNKRLCRLYHSDPAVFLLNQLMRVPGTLNVKIKDQPRVCEVLHESDAQYTSEQLSKLLPPITPEDEEKCREHYDKAYNQNAADIKVTEELPMSFLRLCRLNKQIHKLFYEPAKDRSAADYRLAHLMHANGMSKDDARAVLFNTDKASERTKTHRFNYANNIVDKVWIAEEPEKPRGGEIMPKSVKDILADSGDEDARALRFPCDPMLDGTDYGFRLTHVMGLIGGSGNGKTTTAMNMAAWFTEHNTNRDYIHLYVSLEMRRQEIAEIWKIMAAELKRTSPETDWDSIVYVLDNYNDDGSFRELGFDEIREYVFKLEKATGKKVGLVVLDHIGILKQEKGGGDFDGLIGNCKRMKSFAVATNTFLIMQSQTSRAKNSGGDVELDMDAAFGTSNFEFYCDWIMTTWQPLKRVLDRAPHMTVIAYKFPKIRKKDVLKDRLKADSVYGMMFDPATLRLRQMTSDEHAAFDFWNKQATQIRNKDRKRDPSQLKVVTWTKKADSGDSKPAA